MRPFGVRMLYLVEVRLTGASKSVSFTDDVSQRILTSIFRLNRRQKSRLQYVKVELYRTLRSLSSFRIDDKYVLSARKLPEFEKSFRRVYAEFRELRKEIFEELKKEWPKVKEELRDQLKKQGATARLKDLDRLDPPESPEQLVELRYTLIPLNFLLNLDELIDDEWVRERVRREAERIKEQVKHQYLERIRELEREVAELVKKVGEKDRTIAKLRKLVRSREYYLAKLNNLIPDVDEVSEVLGEETVEELKERAEALMAKLASLRLERLEMERLEKKAQEASLSAKSTKDIS